MELPENILSYNYYFDYYDYECNEQMDRIFKFWSIEYTLSEKIPFSTLLPKNYPKK